MDSSRQIKVSIDLRKVAANLRTREGASATEATARSFLASVGFTFQQDGNWLGPQTGLSRLNHSEVIGVEMG